jgi:hypothetical protein
MYGMVRAFLKLMVSQRLGFGFLKKLSTVARGILTGARVLVVNQLRGLRQPHRPKI